MGLNQTLTLGPGPQFKRLRYLTDVYFQVNKKYDFNLIPESGIQLLDIPSLTYLRY